MICKFLWATFSAIISLVVCPVLLADTNKPNILWITSEDNGPQLGCYGDTYATSPNIDSIAAKGLRFNRCWSNAPVCAPARTTIISGMYATSFGASNMRSRGIRPSNSLILPELMRAEGYYCTNNSKEDYNFVVNGKPWDESSNKAHWRNRPKDRPFFSVFNFTTSHESQIRKRPHIPKHDPNQVVVPPYHPDLPEVREDWAQYYDKIEEMDAQVGKVLAELRADGLEDSTIVFYFGDHGSGMPRSKRWLYQSGLHVPMIVHVPEALRHLAGTTYQPGTSSDRLISFVDLVPTVLHLAGAKLPSYLQGRPFLGDSLPKEPEYLFGFRDRMDERIDMSRAVRNDRYLYVRNFIPYRPQGTYLNYMFQTPTTVAWRKAFREGRLNEAQSFFWKVKPVEELYDIQADPYQINNLSDKTEMAEIKAKMAAGLKQMMIHHTDHGVIPEAIVKGGMIQADWNWKEMVQSAFDASPNESNDLDSTSSNLVVRFWAAQKLLATSILRPESAIEVATRAQTLLKDESPNVQIIAAETVARHLNGDARTDALELLKRKADFRQQGLLVAVSAMNAFANLEATFDDVASLPTKDESLEPVYHDYLVRLKSYLAKEEQ